MKSWGGLMYRQCRFGTQCIGVRIEATKLKKKTNILFLVCGLPKDVEACESNVLKEQKEYAEFVYNMCAWCGSQD